MPSLSRFVALLLLPLLASANAESDDGQLTRRDDGQLKLGTSKIFDVTAFGAVGDGAHNDTSAIRAALAAAGKAGGGVVLLPAPKTFLSGSLHMQSHTIFRVERGATLLGSPT